MQIVKPGHKPKLPPGRRVVGADPYEGMRRLRDRLLARLRESDTARYRKARRENETEV